MGSSRNLTAASSETRLKVSLLHTSFYLYSTVKKKMCATESSREKQVTVTENTMLITREKTHTHSWYPLSKFYIIVKAVGLQSRKHFPLFLLCVGQSRWQRGGRDERLQALYDIQTAKPGLHPRDQCTHFHHRLYCHHERTGRPVTGQGYLHRKTGGVVPI